MSKERDELGQVINKALGDVTGIYDTSESEDQRLADAILAAGYSKPRTIRASDDDLRARLVDLLLAYKGTPRHKLFEYPHRDDDSRAMIGQAAAVALKIIHTLNATEATK